MLEAFRVARHLARNKRTYSTLQAQLVLSPCSPAAAAHFTKILSPHSVEIQHTATPLAKEFGKRFRAESPVTSIQVNDFAQAQLSNANILVAPALRLPEDRSLAKALINGDEINDIPREALAYLATREMLYVALKRELPILAICGATYPLITKLGGELTNSTDKHIGSTHAVTTTEGNPFASLLPKSFNVKSNHRLDLTTVPKTNTTTLFNSETGNASIFTNSKAFAMMDHYESSPLGTPARSCFDLTMQMLIELSQKQQPAFNPASVYESRSHASETREVKL